MKALLTICCLMLISSQVIVAQRCREFQANNLIVVAFKGKYLLLESRNGQAPTVFSLGEQLYSHPDQRQVELVRELLNRYRINKVCQLGEPTSPLQPSLDPNGVFNGYYAIMSPHAGIWVLNGRSAASVSLPMKLPPAGLTATSGLAILLTRNFSTVLPTPRKRSRSSPRSGSIGSLTPVDWEKGSSDT